MFLSLSVELNFTNVFWFPSFVFLSLATPKLCHETHHPVITPLKNVSSYRTS